MKSADGLNSYYLGTYTKSDGTAYDTLSASNTYYITGDKAANVGVTQFPNKLVTLAPAVLAPEKVTTPAVDVAFKLHLYQATLSKDLYFAGDVAGSAWYLATTSDPTKAVDVYLEAVDGVANAYRMYFDKAGTKTYIEVYERNAGAAGKGSGSLRLVTTTPDTYYTYDADLGMLIVKSADGLNSYYLGTYTKSDGTAYDTLSASNTYYISGDKASAVGVTQFPIRLVKAQ